MFVRWLRVLMIIATVLGLMVMLSGCFGAPEDVKATPPPASSQLPFDQVTPRPAEAITPPPQASAIPTIQPIWQPAIAGQGSWYDKQESGGGADIQFVEDDVVTPRPRQNEDVIIYTEAPTVAPDPTQAPRDSEVWENTASEEDYYATDETTYEDTYDDPDFNEPAPEPDIETDAGYVSDDELDSLSDGTYDDSTGGGLSSGDSGQQEADMEYLGDTEDITTDDIGDGNTGGASQESGTDGMEGEIIAPEPEPDIADSGADSLPAPEPEPEPEQVPEETQAPAPQISGRDDLINSGASEATAQNGTRAVLSQDGWIYYASNADNNTLYRATADGSSREKLSSDVPNRIFLLQGMLYYTTDSLIVCANADGSGRTEVAYAAGVTQVDVFGALVAYSDGVNVWVSGTAAQTPGIGFVADNHNGRLFISDGSRIGVMTLTEDGQLVEAQGGAPYAVAGQSVFYAGGGRLLRCDVGASERVLATAEVMWIGVYDKQIYFTTPDGLFRVSPQGEGEILLVPGNVSGVRFTDMAVEFSNDGSGTPNMSVGYDGGEASPL